MLTRGHKILILLLVGLIVIISMLWLLIFRDQTNKLKIDDSSSEQAVTSRTLEYDAPALSENEKTQTALINQAKDFTARFGTYSADLLSSNEVFADIRLMMTDGFESWVNNNYLQSLNSEYSKNNAYYAVVTTVVSAEFVDYNENTAEILVKTKRNKKANPTATDVTVEQGVRVKFNKENDKWLISSVYWE